MRHVRLTVHGPRVMFALTGEETFSSGKTYHPAPGIDVTFSSPEVERRHLGAETVFVILVGWAAKHSLDHVARFLYERLRGKVESVEIEGEEVLVEEAKMLEALRQATEKEHGE